MWLKATPGGEIESPFERRLGHRRVADLDPTDRGPPATKVGKAHHLGVSLRIVAPSADHQQQGIGKVGSLHVAKRTRDRLLEAPAREPRSPPGGSPDSPSC